MKTLRLFLLVLLAAMEGSPAAEPTLEKAVFGAGYFWCVAPLKTFWPAEEYHQDYLRKNPRDHYVLQIALPKIKKLGLKPPGLR